MTTAYPVHQVELSGETYISVHPSILVHTTHPLEMIDQNALVILTQNTQSLQLFFTLSFLLMPAILCLYWSRIPKPLHNFKFFPMLTDDIQIFSSLFCIIFSSFFSSSSLFWKYLDMYNRNFTSLIAVYDLTSIHQFYHWFSIMHTTSYLHPYQIQIKQTVFPPYLCTSNTCPFMSLYWKYIFSNSDLVLHTFNLSIHHDHLLIDFISAYHSLLHSSFLPIHSCDPLVTVSHTIQVSS